ncbi:MAG TPA: S41 family peptidase [Kiritimatiellia bacterium]|jgi:carboxyl-terminal processing protease
MSIRMLGRRLGWFILALLLAANLMLGARLYSQEVETAEREDAYEKIRLFTRVIEQVRAHYVDQEKVTYEELVYSALKGMLQSLDPHSQFMDKESYQDMKDDTSGQFGGLGIVISIKDSVLTIVAPMEDTPGFRAGLQSGDKILEIDGKTTEGLSLPDAVKKLRGDPGTKVTIKILRPKTQDVKTHELERAEIKVASVKDPRIIEDGIGYVRVTQFNEPTADALQEALDKLLADNMHALIVDLRNNPGGLLNSARDVAQKFLKRNDLIVSTEGRDEDQKQVLKARGRTHYLDFPMVVLVNGGSASASEIVAGALQDNNRAILIGEKTFGKGSVQSVLPMDGGTAVRLTTAKYYTPSRRVIHEHGIEPDIVVPMSPDDWRKIRLQHTKSENGDIDVEADDEDTLDDVEADDGKVVDVQLERAVDVLKGIMSYNAKLEGKSSQVMVSVAE